MKWDKYFLDIAKTVARKSPCLKKHVGAIIVVGDRVVSTGYNGPPRKYPHCEVCPRMNKEIGSPYYDCPAVHAEMNCIINAARSGVSIEGGTMYILTGHPCVWCAKLIANSGLATVAYPKRSPAFDTMDQARGFLDAAGITVREV